MNKAWIIFLFILWTSALLTISPILFSFTHTTTSVLEVKSLDGSPSIFIKLITNRPWLDWTGKFAQQKIEYNKETFRYYTLTSDGSLYLKSDIARKAIVSIKDGRPEIHFSDSPQ
jgi:hypothetical protein